MNNKQYFGYSVPEVKVQCFRAFSPGYTSFILEVISLKKSIAITLSLVIVLTVAGCGNNSDINGDTTIQIGEAVYYNTKDVIHVEPAENAIVYVEQSTDNISTNDKIMAYAFINEDTLDGEILVGLIESEWYRFSEKTITAEKE